jgi:hypothetical protein
MIPVLSGQAGRRGKNKSVEPLSARLGQSLDARESVIRTTGIPQPPPGSKEKEGPRTEKKTTAPAVVLNSSEVCAQPVFGSVAHGDGSKRSGY